MWADQPGIERGLRRGAVLADGADRNRPLAWWDGNFVVPQAGLRPPKRSLEIRVRSPMGPDLRARRGHQSLATAP